MRPAYYVETRRTFFGKFEDFKSDAAGFTYAKKADEDEPLAIALTDYFNYMAAQNWRLQETTLLDTMRIQKGDEVSYVFLREFVWVTP